MMITGAKINQLAWLAAAIIAVMAVVCPVTPAPAADCQAVWDKASRLTAQADLLFQRGDWRKAALAYVAAGKVWTRAAAGCAAEDREGAVTNNDTCRRNGEAALCNYLRRRATRFNDEAAIKYEHILNSLSMAVTESEERPDGLVATLRSTPSRLDELEELYDSSKDYWARASVICRAEAAAKSAEMAVATIHFMSRIRSTRALALAAQSSADRLERSNGADTHRAWGLLADGLYSGMGGVDPRLEMIQTLPRPGHGKND